MSFADGPGPFVLAPQACASSTARIFAFAPSLVGCVFSGRNTHLVWRFTWRQSGKPLVIGATTGETAEGRGSSGGPGHAVRVLLCGENSRLGDACGRFRRERSNEHVSDDSQTTQSQNARIQETAANSNAHQDRRQNTSVRRPRDFHRLPLTSSIIMFFV